MNFEVKLLDDQVQNMDSSVIQQIIHRILQGITLVYFEITRHNPIRKIEKNDTGKQNNQYEY